MKVRTLQAFGPVALLVSVILGSSWAVTGSAYASCPNAGFQTGASAGLPDCRAYEQVSPEDKLGFSAYPTPATPVQLSSSDEAIAYFNFEAFPGAVGNTALYAAHVSTRTPKGWRTDEWTPALPRAEVLKAYKVNYVFAPDLKQAILQVPLVPLALGATPYATNLFLRGPEETYSLINSALPATSVEAICGPALLATCWSFTDVVTYAGASSDDKRVMFESNGRLTPEAPSTSALYESVGGHVSLVGKLPDGTPAASSTAGAGSSIFNAVGGQELDQNVERAVSLDGSHVIFQAPADGGPPDSAQAGMTEVYDRIGGLETIELSAPAAEATPLVSSPEPATFQTASTDGSRVFFTSSAELTTPSNTGEANNSEDLYEYDLETRQLTDLTIDTNPTDAATGAMVRGVIEASHDGAYIYFVADGQLVEGKGVDGQPNLYMVHDRGKPVFISTLSGEGTCHLATGNIADSCDWSPFPVTRTAYVTPDGKHMAFMSKRSLSTVNFPDGYGNLDQETGMADSEVYEFTAPVRPEGTGQLICVSCDLAGAQPIGNALVGGLAPSGTIREGKLGLNGISTPFYRVRPLSDDGRRLFYLAPLSLLAPQSSVFEYEQQGTGSCAIARGCQGLISSETATESSYFLGASHDGSDVFLATPSQLTSTDVDNLIDIYDARVDGGIAPPPQESRCESKCAQMEATQTDTPLSTDAGGQPDNLRPSAPSKSCKKELKLSHGKCVHAKKKKRPKQHKKKTHTSRENRRTR